MSDTQQITASIMGVERLRNNVDGPGIRTLVLFDSCPLNCDYCLNRMLMESGIKKVFSPSELLRLLTVDEPYWMVSQGGVTFGGGEPALQSRFIEEFHKLTEDLLGGSDWGIMLETSLNVPLEHIRRLAPVVDRFYVDIKDMNPVIYRKYTEREGEMAYAALEWLVNNGYGHKVNVRVPFIPAYNTRDDQRKSIEILTGMGLETESFDYVKTTEHHVPVEDLESGRTMGYPIRPASLYGPDEDDSLPF